MSKRNILSIILIIGSFIVLVPGLTKPALTISASMSFFGNSMTLFNETRSILQTIETLYKDNNTFVAALIFIFSVLIPIIKGLLLVIILTIKSLPNKSSIHKLISHIHKWSMADVFVIGLFITFLSANATANIQAKLNPGFYYFASYCLLSLLALQIMHFSPQSKS